MKRTPRRLAHLSALALLLAAAAPCAAAAPVLRATLPDGSQRAAGELEDWFPSSERREPLPPFRWLRSDMPAAATPRGPRVEFIGGDCLPGKVVAIEPSPAAAPFVETHLLVSPAVDWNLPEQPRTYLSVLPQTITRIVRRVEPGRRPHPGTAWLADGRTISFHAWHWQPSGIKLLAEGGVRSVLLEDLDEIQFPEPHSLESYFSLLAVLSPQLEARLLVCQTADGLRATSSTSRLRLHHAGRGAEATWFLLQPAWSLDVLCLPASQMQSWMALAPTELPLAWLEPARSLHRAALSAPWEHWRRDANVQGGPLASGGRAYAWGFGVHGYHELEFDLPAAVAGFRTGAGLDAAAGDGGSAEARIEFAGGPSVKHFVMLGRSGPLVGSRSQPLEAAVRLPKHVDGARLRLVADSLAGRSPPGADPLDIRDLVDWLEPMLEFDPARLRLEVARRWLDSIGAHGWSVDGPAGHAWRLVTQWDSDERPVPAFRPAIAMPDGPLSFSSALPCNAGPRELRLGVVRSAARSSPVEVEVKIDGELVGKFQVPTRDERFGWKPLVIPLPDHGAAEADVELRFIPSDARSTFEWHGAAITAGAKSFEKAAETPVRR